MQEIFQDAAQNAVPHLRPQPDGVPRHAGTTARETGLYPALERQAERLGFADLLSVGDEPEQILRSLPRRSDAAEPRRHARRRCS